VESGVWMVNLQVGSMSRFGLMGSWLKEMRACVRGVGVGSSKIGNVIGTKPTLKAVRAVGPEGVSLLVLWNLRHGAH
jgi:hypothetical protein